MCVGLNQHPVYASAYQLQQATQAAIDKVIATYGQDAAAVLSRITYPPAYGSKAALQKLAMECVQSLQKQQQEKQQQEQQQKQQQQQQQQQQQKQQQEQQQKQKQQQQHHKQETRVKPFLCQGFLLQYKTM